MIARTDGRHFLLLVLLDINLDVSTCFPQNSYIPSEGKTLISHQREPGTKRPLIG
jgi:hypothetical protein